MEKKRVGMEIRALNNLIRRYFAFSDHSREIESATGNHGWIICYLADHAEENIYQRDIEDHFTIARSTASRVLSLMEQNGLISRETVAQDARLKKIVLTEKARKLRQIMREDAIVLESTLIKGFREEEVDVFISYLQRMKENIINQKCDEEKP